MTETDINLPQESSPQTFELEMPDEYSKFLLYSRSEIIFVLRNLIQKNAMITVYFDAGNSFFLTAVLALSADNSKIIFDYGSDETMNRRAVQASKLIFTTMIDKVKVQFSLTGLSKTSYEGRAAFIGALPEVLLRLQRREYFRLSTPIASPLRCTIPSRRPDNTPFVMQSQLLDISGGGLGLMIDPEDKPNYPTGRVFAECKIALPDEGLLSATLCVRNTFDVTTKTGARHVRVGCEFIDLTGPRLTMIQRYITRIERERKARMSGL